jgi:hypothetical protein
VPADDAAAQIAEEIDARLLWPLESLLGPGEEFTLLRQRAAVTARMMAAQLASGDDKLAGQTAIDLAASVLPDEIPDEFWATPLGRLIAKSVGHPGAEEVSYSVAAAMLGVSKTRVQQLVSAGKLERHPDGGITSASVRLRASAAPES